MTDTNENNENTELDVTAEAGTEGAQAEPAAETPNVEPNEDTKEPDTEPVQPAAPVKLTVPANPALVEWPRDEWGSLSNLRRELLLAASNIRGQDDKHELYLKTLQIAAMHALARLAGDKAAVEAELLQEAQRVERAAATGRVYGQAVD